MYYAEMLEQYKRKERKGNSRDTRIKRGLLLRLWQFVPFLFGFFNLAGSFFVFSGRLVDGMCVDGCLCLVWEYRIDLNDFVV